MGQQPEAKTTGGSANAVPSPWGDEVRRVWAMTESGPVWMKVPLAVIASVVTAVVWAVELVVKVVWVIVMAPVRALRSRRDAVEEIGSPMHGVKHRDV